jgi:Leucine-rich repeat (LRR) protein
VPVSKPDLPIVVVRGHVTYFALIVVSVLFHLIPVRVPSHGSRDQPDTIGSLPSLEELWLDCNEISELPPVSRINFCRVVRGQTTSDIVIPLIILLIYITVLLLLPASNWDNIFLLHQANSE